MVIEKMHVEFPILYNKVNSNHKKTFSAAEIDLFINRGIREYEEIFWSGENRKGYKLGFEVTQQRTDMLATLVVSNEPLLAPTNFNSTLKYYEFDLSGLSKPYAHFITAKVKITDCDDFFTVNIDRTQNLYRTLEDVDKAPSKLWQRAIGQIKGSSDPNTEYSLYVYTNGEFEIDGLYIEYLKEPAEVALGTYTDVPTLANPSPGIKPQVNCDLPSQYHDLVLDIAVQEATRIIVDVDGFNLRKTRITEIGH